jgi:ribulose 1,5-bisphosphate carboxylase large subunit-like protein
VNAIVECRNAHYLSCSQITEVTHMHRRSALIPLIVAVVGQGIILLHDFGPGIHSHGNGMIAAAAVARAGAIEFPVGP